MSDRIKGELGKVARGGVLSLIGLVASAIFAFLARALVGRTFGPVQYGAYSLTLTVFSIALVLAMFGLPTGLPRQVSYFFTKNRKRVGELVSTTLILVTITSTLTLAILLPLTERLAGLLTANPEGRELLKSLLPLVLLGLPFAALMNTLIAVAQGYKRVREYVYYGKIGFPLTYLVLAFLAVYVIGSLRSVIIAYVVSYLIILMMLLRDLRRAGIVPGISFSRDLVGVIVLFSLPLLTSNIVAMVLTWTDSLMLGHYLGSGVVGLYTSASPLARFISMTVMALMTIYTPVVTGFFAEGKLELVERFYAITSKWSVLLTFPLLFLFVEYPEQVIGTLFGPSYTEASKVLVILSLGFALVAIAGPLIQTLVTMGKTVDNMKGDIMGAMLNIFLNYTLIQSFGMIGAAIATFASYATTTTYKLSVLIRSGIKPYGKRHALLLADAGVILAIFHFIKVTGIIQALVATAVATLLFYGIAVLVGVPEKEDVELIKSAGEKYGVPVDWLIRILGRTSREEF
ncbi:flippase [Thermococcus nautili]|uniref:Membrane protein involved in the export of O-antigen and teichoic acid n=1 Tax=Thermococcus nautili TaxID=195522 RepID=W8P5Z6_9EURY|nr:flippase [Thermococcus nautili]AHL22945.1 Membrane protein involved in the export of O-antigen and teichoic acid [Thermococcus nautili]CAI1492595.1 Membrane protein involved in the export of O-antigen and teichoic acid [Thermococcus nautili]